MSTPFHRFHLNQLQVGSKQLSCSWSLELSNGHSKLVANSSVHVPEMVFFHLQTDSIDNLPCCYCSVNDPAFLEIETLDSGILLSFFLGRWPEAQVGAWCRDFITLGTHQEASQFQMCNKESVRLRASRSRLPHAFHFELVASSLYDLPCEICQFSEPPPVELEKKSGLRREFRMALGDFPTDSVYGFCSRMRAMLSAI